MLRQSKLAVGSMVSLEKWPPFSDGDQGIRGHRDGLKIVAAAGVLRPTQLACVKRFRGMEKT
jgi:hypothetical protein